MLIYLVRHALARYDTGLPYGIAPGPVLSDTGVEQAAAAARLLEGTGIERVVSSPMRRCVMTAEPICAHFGLDLELDDDLGEMETGESAAAMGLRMLRAVLAQVNHPVVALVSHAAPLEQLISVITHNRAILPPPGDRGARIGVGHVWQLLHHSGEWRARHIEAGGVRA